MTLLRRLTAIASQPGELGPASLLGPVGAAAAAPALQRQSAYAAARQPAAASAAPRSGPMSVAQRPRHRFIARRGDGRRRQRRGGGGGGQYNDGLTGLMAVNLIRAHREELIQASTGKLDHMVIDVVGSLFDQILSDSRVPPQMAREIARLQLPVLRVALSDATFFSTRRHPVRRFINRIASLANAFDDFDIGPGAKFLTRVRKLVDEIVEGDFDQIELYAAKVADLETFIAEQTEGAVEKTGAAVVLDAEGVRAARPAALHAAAAGGARADAAAGVPAGIPGPGLEPGAGARGAPRRRRLRPRQALSPRRHRPGDEHPAEGLAGVSQEVPDAAAAADEGPQRRHEADRLARAGAEGILRQAAAGARRIAQGPAAERARPQPARQAARIGVRDAGAAGRDLRALRAACPRSHPR